MTLQNSPNSTIGTGSGGDYVGGAIGRETWRQELEEEPVSLPLPLA
jgi:hypothetical protein